LHFHCACNTKIGEVFIVVFDVSDHITHNLHAHLQQIFFADLSDLVGKLMAVTVKSLHGHGSDNGTLVAFHGVLDDFFHFVIVHSQELSCCLPQRLVFFREAHLSHSC
jgi:hypothetical protein